jgi:hypothetical protein
MALKDLKSDLGKFRTVVKPDGKSPDPPKPVEFGEYVPISYVSSTYDNARKFSTPSILSFARPSTDDIDVSDVTKLESNYDNDSIKKYTLESKLEAEATTIQNKPETSGNNEKSPIDTNPVKTSGNNENTNVTISKVPIQGNNEKSPIEINKVNISGNNEKSTLEINRVEISGNNESSLITPIKSDLSSKQLVDNSILNLDSVVNTIPSGRHESDNSILNIDGKIKIYDVNSKLIKLDSSWNVDGTPVVTMAGGRYELPKKSNYGFIDNAPSVDFFSNTFFTGFSQNQKETLYTGNTSIFSFSGKSKDAPSTNFFSNTNVTDGFHTFAKLGDSKFLYNSIYGNIGTVDFFSNINVSEGFTANMKLYDTKFLNNSIYGNIAPVDMFSNQFAFGFTEKYNTTQFTPGALDYGFKGTIPSVNFFSNTNVTDGFHTFAKLGDSKFIFDSSIFGWSGSPNTAPAVNFFSNTNATGFTLFQNSTMYALDSSIHTWKGSAQNAPEVNFFSNINTTSGFTNFAFGRPTQFILDSSAYTWKGGRSNAPAVDFFPNTNRDGFKTFNKLYESYYKFDSTILHEVATTPFESARTGGSSYKLNGQLIKSPLFNNIGFSGGTAKYVDVLKTKQFNSILGDTANKRNSPSLLDTQYDKFDLLTDSFNVDYVNQPYVIRGIQNRGVTENERWGAPVAIADGLIRGGALTVANRTIADVKRIGNFMRSTKGITFIVKQVGLHLASQNQETTPTDSSLNIGLNPIKIYNPIAQLLSVVGNPFGQHFTRHGLIPILSNTKYENAVKYRNENETNTFKTINEKSSAFSGYQNRLLQLTKELLFPITSGYQLVNAYDSVTLNALQARGKEKLSYKNYYNKVTIDRLSYLTGPGSVYGIGSTIVNRVSNSIPKDAFQLYSNKIHYRYGLSHRHPQGVQIIKTTSDPLITDSDEIRGDLQEFLRYAEIASEKNKLFISEGLEKKSRFNLVPLWSQMKSPFSRKLSNDYNVEIKGNDYIIGYADLNQVVPEDGFKQSVVLDQNQTYATLKYTSIPDGATSVNATTQETKLNNRKLKDFRWGLGETEMVNEYPLQKTRTQALRALFTNPKIVDFEKNNLTDRFGFGEHGKPGLYRDNPTKTHRSSIGINGEEIKSPRKFIGDRIQLIDFKNEIDTENKNKIYELDGKNKYGFDGAEDLIEFYITGPKRKDRCIVFRATINDIQDNFTPSYNTIKYLGRADPIYLYSSFERSVSLSFQIGITSRDELRSRWRSINALAAYTAPEYLANGRMRAPLMKLTLGHMFRQTPVFINNLNYTFDNSQITWETAKLALDGVKGQDQSVFGTSDTQDPSAAGVLQLPKFITVRLDLKIIGNYRPQLNGDSDGSPDMGIMYNLYDTDDGVLPTKDDKYIVNYFSDTVVVQPAQDNSPKKQVTPTDEVSDKKPGTKNNTSPSATTPPSREGIQTAPLTFPYVNGDYLVQGEVNANQWPPDVPTGYSLVKGPDLVPRYVSPRLLDAQSSRFTLIEQPEVSVKNYPSSGKIRIYDLNTP